MKKLLFSGFFIFILGSFGSIAKAHSTGESAVTVQKQQAVEVAAYPNPAKDFLVVESTDPLLKIKSLTFYSILGVQVANYLVNMNAGEISLEKLRPGKYLMKYILSDNSQKVIQIIKQ